MYVTHPDHHILAESNILLPREEYRTKGFSLCSLLPSVIPIHLTSHVFLSTQFSSTLHLHVWRSTPLRSNAVQSGIHAPRFPRNLLPPERGLTMQLKRVRWHVLPDVNHLTPNGHYMGRTAQLTSRCCIVYIYSTNIRTEYFKHVA